MVAGAIVAPSDRPAPRKQRPPCVGAFTRDTPLPAGGRNRVPIRVTCYKILTMRLAQFILANMEAILQEWEDFARSLSQGDQMESLALRNDAELILRAAVRDMGVDQTADEQTRKSHGKGVSSTESDHLDDASSHHAYARFGSGFNINEVVSEYRALRASVLRLWTESRPAAHPEDHHDVTRFNEAIDQSLGISVQCFADRIDHSRRMFLAILGHDLRNPLNAIKMSAWLAASRSQADPESAQVLAGIDTSVQAISRLIMDLLDFAAAGLGAGMAVRKTTVDLERLAREVLEESRAAYPGRAIQFNCAEGLTCTCDGPRLRQVMSNLLGNALTHGSVDEPIDVTLFAEAEDILLTVRNQGPPIPPARLKCVFDPMNADATTDSETPRRPGSLGLGLYIAREIVAAHDGAINITSSAQDGTVVTVRLPRQPRQHAG